MVSELSQPALDSVGRVLRSPLGIKAKGQREQSDSDGQLEIERHDAVEDACERLGQLARPLVRYLRMRDATIDARVDAYLADSSIVARRLQKYYKRDAEVLYPPNDVEDYRDDGSPGVFVIEGENGTPTTELPQTSAVLSNSSRRSVSMAIPATESSGSRRKRSDQITMSERLRRDQFFERGSHVREWPKRSRSFRRNTSRFSPNENGSSFTPHKTSLGQSRSRRLNSSNCFSGTTISRANHQR